ncbi:MAG: prolyl oligopeptidase family serine peptidase, partial [Myxococcota bacterium]
EKAIAMITTPDSKLLSYEGWSRLEILDRQTSKVSMPETTMWRKQAPSAYGWLSAPRWSADSRQLSFMVSFDGYPSEFYILQWTQDRKIGKITHLKRPEQLHLERRVIQWHPKRSSLCYRGIREALSRVYCTSFVDGVQGKTELISQEDHHTRSFHISSKGQDVALLNSTRTILFDAFVRGKDTQGNVQFKRMTHINLQIDHWKIPTIRKVRWKSKDGTPVEGILELPPRSKPGQRLPLVVILHGGPTSSSKWIFRFAWLGRTTFASRGWATLSPNYRGSTGYGDTFLKQLIGHKNDRDVADIMSGVEYLIKKGIVDPKRMAVMGWSNGGYLTNCLITRTHRFKAASSGAGVFDTAMQWMIEDTPGHVINFNKGLPWNRAQSMLRSSPLYHAGNIRTPTLIHVGERDARVPPEHSYALYRSLRRYLHVPTQLLVYPKAFHGLRSKAHRSAKMEWDIRWFDHYVLGKQQGERSVDKPSKTRSVKKKELR